MFHWSPLEDVQVWEPTFGWNNIFSEQDKIQCVTLFFFFKKKGIKDSIAEILSHMILFKQKYHIKYSDEQEDQLTLFTRQQH